MSFKSFVPFVVPSVTHISVPCTPSSVMKSVFDPSTVIDSANELAPVPTKFVSCCVPRANELVSTEAGCNLAWAIDDDDVTATAAAARPATVNQRARPRRIERTLEL
jgi:hypothetical protein